MKHTILAGILAALIGFGAPAAVLARTDAAAQAVAASTASASASPSTEASETAAVTTQSALSYDARTMVTLLNGDQTLTLPLGEYLEGVVLAEMPASFEPDALKAQAVAARTFTLRQMAGGKHGGAVCTDSTCCQAWLSPDAAREKLGNSYQTYLDKIQEAVEETDGCVLTYGGELIDATFFSCSGGRTEDAAAVWGTEVAYLQSVDSPGEEDAASYEKTVVFSEEEFREKILAANSEAALDGPASGWFGDAERTAGGGIATLTIGGQAFRGTALRSLLGLPSTDFTVVVTADGIEFDCLGSGHRVGMSQYGAEAMALNGADWTEILTHYYTGASLDWYGE